MKTPEEFAAQIGSALWNGDDAAELIRARDEEVAEQVRAETLAGFGWEVQPPWDPSVQIRRRVGPWEPAP